MTPAKKARVCSISFSALRPTNVTKSSDFCNKEQKNHDVTTEKIGSQSQPNSYLPKPGQHAKQQNCAVHQYGHKLMNKMEVAGKGKKNKFLKLLSRHNVNESIATSSIKYPPSNTLHIK